MIRSGRRGTLEQFGRRDLRVGTAEALDADLQTRLHPRSGAQREGVLRGTDGIVRSRIPVPEAAEDRERLAARDREISRLKARLAAGGGASAGGVRPENLIWLFGVARTGSSWLGAMMGDLEGHAMWNEPYVGDV